MHAHNPWTNLESHSAGRNPALRQKEILEQQRKGLRGQYPRYCPEEQQKKRPDIDRHKEGNKNKKRDNETCMKNLNHGGRWAGKSTLLLLSSL